MARKKKDSTPAFPELEAIRHKGTCRTNHGGFGRWGFLEVTDPYDDVVELIRSVTNRDTF
jgi:hypothetical protein